MYVLMAFISGLIMSAGLIISGMVNPQKVIGFLDIFGSFDPTLAFVMVGALLIQSQGIVWLGIPNRCYVRILICQEKYD